MAVWKAVLANGTLFWAQLLGLEGSGMESVWGAGFKVLKNVSALFWMLNISGYQPGSARQAFVVVFLCTCKCCILHAEILLCFSQTVQLCDDWMNPSYITIQLLSRKTLSDIWWKISICILELHFFIYWYLELFLQCIHFSLWSFLILLLK